jgi:UDP-N-acetylglucosamine diphosphorylase/glucosamine-1-phosphate N-acetyltransferase
MKHRIVVFEDQFLADMSPVALTRPAFAATCACLTLWDIAAAAGEARWVVRDHLAKLAARRYGAAAAFRGSGIAEPTLFLNASVAPDARYVPGLAELAAAGRPFVCTSGRRVSAALVPAGTRVPEPLSAEAVTPWLLELKLPLSSDETFRTLDHQFELVRHLEELFPANLAFRIARDGLREVRPGLYVADGVTIADTAVFRVKDGPVALGREAVVGDFSYFEGPVYVGPRTRLIERASLKGCVCLGEVCKVGGEVEASVIESCTNKQHHGFLGHSWVGSWVNLGAGTSTSDLKNTYGEVRIELPRRRIDTGMQFLGCIVGDFAKTAINTSIFTGKVIGVASMLYGFVGSSVPSFCNYARSFGQITECPLDQALLIQKRMFARRGIEQTPEDVEVLRSVFEMTRGERLLSDEPPSL